MLNTTEVEVSPAAPSVAAVSAAVVAVSVEAPAMDEGIQISADSIPVTDTFLKKTSIAVVADTMEAVVVLTDEVAATTVVDINATQTSNQSQDSSLDDSSPRLFV